MKKTIRDFELSNQKVIIRCDFNVPLEDGRITDTTRIDESLPTICYAVEKGAKVILFSHMGRIKEEGDKSKYSLSIVADSLSEKLEKTVLFSKETRGPELENLLNQLQAGDVLLVENTRYEDLNGKLESSNDKALGQYWASLGDVFINDAFGTSHRAHASNVGIAAHLPSGIGFLIEKELKFIGEAVHNPKRPLTVILGGAKVKDKIGVIQNLVHLADYIIIGGGMAYTFLKAKGYEIGKSLLDEESISFCQTILKDYENKIILPVDGVMADGFSKDANVTYASVLEMDPNDMGLDIGEKSIFLFKGIIEQSETVIWNGPVGVFEWESFSKGTKALCEILSEVSATTIIGGGDTAAAAAHFGYQDKFDHISTGGGATLVMLEGEEMPGIKIISEK